RSSASSSPGQRSPPARTAPTPAAVPHSPQEPPLATSPPSLLKVLPWNNGAQILRIDGTKIRREAARQRSNPMPITQRSLRGEVADLLQNVLCDLRHIVRDLSTGYQPPVDVLAE